LPHFVQEVIAIQSLVSQLYVHQSTSPHYSHYLVLLRLASAVTLTILSRKTKTLGHLVEDVDVAVGTTESGLARTPGVDGDISEGVDADSLAGGEGAVDEETARGICLVGDVLAVEFAGGLARTVLVDLVVLDAVGGGAYCTLVTVFLNGGQCLAKR
jgi:hypothetical protein